MIPVFKMSQNISETARPLHLLIRKMRKLENSVREIPYAQIKNGS